jgi:8-oxo-dGTP diphosphatase
LTLPIVTVVGAILEDDQGRTLLTQRPADKSMPFLWEFPGGKVEAGEKPEDALVRELYEEIGIIALPDSLEPLTFVSLTYPDFHIILLCYQCLRWTGTPIAREGQEGIEWVLPQDLHKYPMRKANLELIPLLMSRAGIKDSEMIDRFSSVRSQ